MLQEYTYAELISKIFIFFWDQIICKVPNAVCSSEKEDHLPHGNALIFETVAYGRY